VITSATVVSMAGLAPATRRSLDLADAALTAAGVTVTRVDVPELGLPDRDDVSVAESFSATPGTLMESWRIARHLDASTEPGDLVVVPDEQGFGGVFALAQAMALGAQQREVWTVAGSGTSLTALDTVGTIEGFDEEVTSAVDWEIVQYRFSARVLTTSPAAVGHLATLGVETCLLPVTPRAGGVRPVGPVFGLPEAAARHNHTLAALRGLAGQEVVVSTETQEDAIWTGTTLDTVRAWAAHRPGVTFGDTRDVDTPVLGNAFAPLPDGFRPDSVIVRAASTAARQLPDAPEWSDEDDLARLVSSRPASRAPVPSVTLPARVGLPREVARATRISVGIPVYRNVTYLDEAINSILDQTEPVHELLLYDDGSDSSEVTDALAAWEARDRRIRAMSGPNRGVCVARNAILEAMAGDAFFLIDSDDIAEPVLLEACATALRANADLVAVATWTRFFGFYNGIEAKPPYDRRVGLRENPIISTGALIDMSVRDAGTRFVADLAFLYCEDWQFWSQIVAAGGHFGLVPEPLIRHRAHEQSGATRRTAQAQTVGRARAVEPLLGS